MKQFVSKAVQCSTFGAVTWLRAAFSDGGTIGGQGEWLTERF